MFQLSGIAIKREELIQSLKNDKAGALVVFEGWVRDHNQGKVVQSLEYQVYEALVIKEGEKILREAAHKFNLHQAQCTHRFGHLALGETAVWIGAIASHRDDAFKACRYIIDEIKLRLPIWKREHYQNENPEWVFCKDHHTHVHFYEADYYKKQQALLPQERLKKARVLVVGAGGLGCPVLTGLAAAGVGHIEVADFDRVSISNIHRQPLYSPAVVGEKKVTVAQNKLSELNPFIHVHGHDARVGMDNIERLIQGQSLVLDCTDNLESKYLLHDACFKYRVPLISASIYKFEGQLRTFDPRQASGCLRCTQRVVPDDGHLGNCNDFGVLGAAVAALGSLQATEAVSLLCEGTNSSLNETFFFNIKKLSVMKIKNIQSESCVCCAGKMEFTDERLEISAQDLGPQGFHLVDIREQDDEFLEGFIEDSRKIVVCCHRGIRSKRLVRDLRARGYDQFYSLKGGAGTLEASC